MMTKSEYDETFTIELPHIESTRLQRILWKSGIAGLWLRLRIATIKLRRQGWIARAKLLG